jgi:hypothetical protein
MNRAKFKLLKDLDRISEEIYQISMDLRVRVKELSNEEGEKLEKKVEFMKRIYERNNNIPTWPINYVHLWRLATTQIVPGVGLAWSAIKTALDNLPR